MFRHHHKLENLVLNLRKIVSTEVSAERHQNWMRISFLFHSFKMTEKMQDYQLCCGIWPAVR